MVVVGQPLQAAVVDKPQRTGPRWQTQALRDSAAVRDFAAAWAKVMDLDRYYCT